MDIIESIRLVLESVGETVGKKLDTTVNLAKKHPAISSAIGAGVLAKLATNNYEKTLPGILSKIDAHNQGGISSHLTHIARAIQYHL